jgi:hypothetical protein
MTDTTAAYVGIVSGFNPANPATSKRSTHSQLDIGSFIMEMGGVRWFIDLGMEDYNAAGYFNQLRFRFYRAMTQGHNTLCISTAFQQPLQYVNQAFSAEVKQTRFVKSSTLPAWSFEILDMTEAYANQTVTSATRGIAFIKRTNVNGGLPWVQVMVQDEVTSSSPVDVVSMFHTAATTISIDASGKVATFTQNNIRLRGVIQSPSTGSWAKITADASGQTPAGQNANVGITNMVVRASALTTSVTISVYFQLEAGYTSYPNPGYGPLSSWPLAISR